MCLIYGGLFGGPDRDRTDDLFRAIFEPQNIDGTVLTTGRTGRKGPMGAICGQNAGKLQPSGQRADRVESAQ
jgi:hypothetical protein